MLPATILYHSQVSVTIRQVFPANSDQNHIILNRIWVAEHGGENVGQIKLDYLGEPESRIAFASNLIVGANLPEVAAMLIQKLINEARSQGFKSVTFSIEPGQTALMALVQSGKAQVVMTWAKVDI